MADKENTVLRNETMIESLNATVNTHTATITTLQNTLTQVNGLKAQLEAQVQSLQVFALRSSVKLQIAHKHRNYCPLAFLTDAKYSNNKANSQGQLVATNWLPTSIQQKCFC